MCVQSSIFAFEHIFLVVTNWMLFFTWALATQLTVSYVQNNSSRVDRVQWHQLQSIGGRSHHTVQCIPRHSHSCSYTITRNVLNKQNLSLGFMIGATNKRALIEYSIQQRFIFMVVCTTGQWIPFHSLTSNCMSLNTRLTPFHMQLPSLIAALPCVCEYVRTHGPFHNSIFWLFSGFLNLVKCCQRPFSLSFQTVRHSQSPPDWDGMPIDHSSHSQCNVIHSQFEYAPNADGVECRNRKKMHNVFAGAKCKSYERQFNSDNDAWLLRQRNWYCLFTHRLIAFIIRTIPLLFNC